MAHDASHHTAPTRQFVLPVLVFGLPEVRRLRRELETLEEFMNSSAIRAPGTQAQLPRLSRMCEALAAENHLSLLQQADRGQLLTFIKSVETAAPQMHISFAADPSSAFTAKVVTWLRASIHPYTMVQIGLQPTIAAGCVVRTANKVFDFSLRERFTKTEDLLIQSLEAESATALQPQPAPTAQAAPVQQGIVPQGARHEV